MNSAPSQGQARVAGQVASQKNGRQPEARGEEETAAQEIDVGIEERDQVQKERKQDKGGASSLSRQNPGGRRRSVCWSNMPTPPSNLARKMTGSGSLTTARAEITLHRAAGLSLVRR